MQRFYHCPSSRTISTTLCALRVAYRWCAQSGYEREPVTLQDKLIAHVPKLFSTITNIERKLPPELRAAVEANGGLRRVLRDDERFLTSSIGSVFVARVRSDTNPSQRAQKGRGKHHRAGVVEAPPSEQSDVALPMWCARNMYPRFCAPLSAICRGRNALAQQQQQRQVGQHQMNDLAAVITEDMMRISELPLLSKHLEVVEILGEWYVRPSNAHAQYFDAVTSAVERSLHTSARLECDSTTNTSPTEDEDEGDSSDLFDELVRDGPLSCESTSEGHTDPASERIICLSDLEWWLQQHGFLVENFEVYRVARLLQCSQWTAAAALREECDSLLPLNRDLGHVIGTAPHLFETRREHGTDALLLRYCVPRSCIARRHYTPGDIAKMERSVYAMRRMRFPAREKMRRLLREIEEARGPSPFLDPNVFAYALVDCLPACGSPVRFTTIMNNCFSESQRNCRPTMLQPFFERFRNIFVVTQERNSNFLLIARRLSAPAAASSTSSSDADGEDPSDTFASDEEVVVSMFERFPATHNPNVPIPYHSVRALLSLRVQRSVRSRGLAPIVATQSDNIEIVPSEPPHEASGSNQAPAATLRLRRHYSAPDTLGATLLRFKGQYLTSLLEAYRSHFPD